MVDLLETLKFVNGHPYMLIDNVWLAGVYGGAEPDPVADQQQDLAKIQDFMKGQIDSYMAEKYPQGVQPTLQSSKSQEDVVKEQLGQLINPFVEPALNEARLTSSDAKDYVQFYMHNPDAKEYHDDVEKTFTALVKAGRPISRTDILKHKLGEEYQTNPEKFVEKQTTKHKEQLQRAEVAVDFGTAALNKAKSDSTFTNFDSKSLEDMEKALEGVTF